MRRALLVVLVALAAAPAAVAGGDFVDLTGNATSVWVVGAFGIRELALDGRTLWAPRPTRPASQLSVALAGGAAWVASIENGYVDGRLARVDTLTHRMHVVLRVPDGSVQYVAAGAGGVYALIGEAKGNRLVRVSTAGRVTGQWKIGDGGRIAADASGCWVSGAHRLLHVNPRGRLTVAARVGFGDVATGGGVVWIGLRSSLVRVDERTREVRTIKTQPLRTGGFQHDIAVGGGFLWTVGVGALQRRSLGSGHVERAARVPGVAEAVSVLPTGVWVASTAGVFRFDPSTLQRTLRVLLD
jgi:hypothetical protein